MLDVPVITPAPNLLCVPSLGSLSGDAYREAAAAAAQDCVQRGAFLIAEPPADWRSVKDVVREASAVASAIGENGAIYWPPLIDAVLSEEVEKVYVRTDETRGVWKAPAGIDASLGNVTPAVALSSADIGVLTRMNVNAIRRLPQRGTVVWGARTMSSNTDFRYVPVRRLILHIEQSILSLQQWSVLQPDNASTWNAVTVSVNAFLNTLWRQGALAGTRPQDAYFVRCDASTMSQDDIDNGRLIVMVGVAPTTPAEFVLLRIGLWTLVDGS